MEGKNLKGNVVVHGVGVRDLFYSTPDLTGWEFVGQFTEIDAESADIKVQSRFRNPMTGEEFAVLLLPSRI